MLTDEQQWDHLKNQFHFTATEFLNYLQTLSAKDISETQTMRQLIHARHNTIEAFLQVFRFVENANEVALYKLLSEKQAKPEDS